ncbi:MAG: nucleotidyltransferase family protein, partial [Promethearchaeota archaeon]
MKSELKLKEETKGKIISILVKHGIKRILVFGSYARNEATPKSDLDLIVDFPEGTS